MPVDKSKIGQFFIFIGLILVVIFFALGVDQSAAFGYLFGGLGLLFLGWTIYWRDHKAVDPNTDRFRTVRKIREYREKRREGREQRKRK